ncbi:MAG: glycerol-3-phosphate 1-O-acyltransferase PlsY [Nitrospirae bacterium]|nr:glycerol-3-phosphate 1-O-acyltransferase PlsY [Nitrospirota bacterium]
MSSDTLWHLIALSLAGYLLGSIPFGVLATRALGLTDPRSAGSGNIGFTNVLRVGGKAAGALTLLGDIGKGWLVGWGATRLLGDETTVLPVAFCAVLGHLFPVFLKFRGGKGVATAIGAVAGVAPWLGLGLGAIWMAAFGIWRYSSGAALTAFACLPVLALWQRPTVPFLMFAVTLTALIVWRHQANIVRLRAGTEPKIGQDKMPEPLES